MQMKQKLQKLRHSNMSLWETSQILRNDLIHWKDHLKLKNQENKSSGGIFKALKTQVQRVRKNNDPPGRDTESFSRYVCDLCHISSPLSGLRQCVICGRWGCSSCWHDEYYLCRSCGGIMKLLLLEEPASDPQNMILNEISEPPEDCP